MLTGHGQFYENLSECHRFERRLTITEERAEYKVERETDMTNRSDRTLVAYYLNGGWFGYLYRYGKDVWGGFTWHPDRVGSISRPLRSETLARQFIEHHAGQSAGGVWTEVNVPLPPDRF